MKNIIYYSFILSGFASAATVDAQNLLNELFKSDSFTCNNEICIDNDYTKTNDIDTYIAKNIIIKFKDSNFDFKFDRITLDKLSKKHCLNSVNDTCIEDFILKAAADPTKKLFSKLVSIDANDIKYLNNGDDTESVKNINISSNINKFPFDIKEIKDLEIEDLNSNMTLTITGLSVPGTKFKNEALEKLKDALPDTKIIIDNTDPSNISKLKNSSSHLKDLELKTIKKINNNFISMYSILINEMYNDSEFIKTNYIASFDTKIQGNHLLVSVWGKDNDKLGINANAKVELEIENIEEILSSLKYVTNKAEKQNFNLEKTFDLIKNASFKKFNVDMELKTVKDYSDSLRKSNADYAEIYNEAETLISSVDFKKDSQHITEIDIFKLKSLLLTKDDTILTIDNPGMVPLMSLVMKFLIGSDISEFLRITHSFSKLGP